MSLFGIKKGCRVLALQLEGSFLDRLQSLSVGNLELGKGPTQNFLHVLRLLTDQQRTQLLT